VYGIDRQRVKHLKTLSNPGRPERKTLVVFSFKI
jgi:hypothetical protein